MEKEKKEGEEKEEKGNNLSRVVRFLRTKGKRRKCRNRSCFIRNVIDLVSPRIQVFLECGVHVESEGTAISSDR